MQIGFLINPIAGMGGAVGLKGTDGARLAEARARGAVPRAPERARAALEELRPLESGLTILAAPGAMGADLARTLGFRVVEAPIALPLETTGETSARAAEWIADQGPDLILFVGGDGMARDLLSALGPRRLPVLGAPAGVKMHSGVFAASPRAAGILARTFLTAGERSAMLTDAEIVDRPETATGDAPPELYGIVRAPDAPHLRAHPKARRAGTSDSALEAALRAAAAGHDEAMTAVIGPGATMATLKRALGGIPTLLGVDVFRDGRQVITDASADDLRAVMREGPAMIFVSPTGGQGFLFGRGNQQIAPDVIASVLDAHGRSAVRVFAAGDKLASLPRGTLYVDTGDPSVDARLAGHIAVVTGPRRRMMMQVIAPEAVD